MVFSLFFMLSMQNNITAGNINHFKCKQYEKIHAFDCYCFCANDM